MHPFEPFVWPGRASHCISDESDELVNIHFAVAVGVYRAHERVRVLFGHRLAGGRLPSEPQLARL
jgi:hypothetical protein